MTDIKQALAAAFDDEPPLTIDRAAILRTGRRRAAFRRGYIAVTVLATAAVVCVPAVLGSGGGGGSAQVGGVPPSGAPLPTAPSTSVTASAPAATTVTGAPVSTGPSTTWVTSSPGFATSTSVTAPAPPVSPTARRASELTQLLASSGAIPAGARFQPYPGYPTGPWEFAVDEGGYEAVADVTTAAGRGRVMVSLGGGEAPKCDPAFNTPRSTCENRVVEGHSIVVRVTTSNDVQPVTFVAVCTSKSDGTLVEATAMNGDPGKTGITGANPPLNAEQLAKIATLPGLTF
ncbi:hypothetical protein Q5530_02675 [Saccharothrix sp. BKS2]|uniref:hypothetical protein n=1 Tax=Saccharothrix sp. BKS2 TaxID=3064400 RepID=UPI0039E94665